MTTTDTGSGYMKQLDGLRAIAVSMVLVSHFPPSQRLNQLLPWGQLGVDLFFVLSGFLITGILLRCRADVDRGLATRGSELRTFYLRRALRIFPIYYLTLLLLSVWNIGNVRAYLPYHATYLTNVFIAVTGERIPVTGHFWSLAVEEQFYLFWPWLILFTPQPNLLKRILGLMACGPLFLLVTGYLHWSVYASRAFPLCNLHTLCGGALLALATHDAHLHGLRDRMTPVGGVVGALGMSALLTANAFGVHIPYGVKLVGTGLFSTPLFMALVSFAAQSSTGALGRVLEARPLVYLGQISYCVYLVHLPMPEILDRLATATGASWLSVSHDRVIRLLQIALSSVAIASLSMRAIERPLRKLKSRLPSPASRHASSALRGP